MSKELEAFFNILHAPAVGALPSQSDINIVEAALAPEPCVCSPMVKWRGHCGCQDAEGDDG